MLRYLLTGPRTRLQKGINLFFAFLVLAAMLLLFYSQITDTETGVDLPIRSKSDTATVLRQFPGARVLTESRLLIEHPTLDQRLLAPSNDSLFDPLYTFWIIVAMIISIIYLRDFSVRNPFTRKAVTGIRLLAFFTAIIFFLSFLREIWFRELVKDLTRDQFALQARSFPFLAFLAILALQRIVQVFRKGYQLSLEQQYTV
jgi:hypothetical protein